MRELKYHITLDRDEKRNVIDSLNKMRNKLIAAGKYTDAVDDILLKVANAPIKKFKVNYERYIDRTEFI